MTKTIFYIDDEPAEEKCDISTNNKMDEKKLRDFLNIFMRKKDKRVESFIDRLNKYSAVVLQKSSAIYDEFLKKCYYLEDKWTDVIHDCGRLSKKRRLQQQAIWEFFVTERNYIKKLRVIVEVFQQYFKICQSEGDLLEIDQNKLFANISEVLLANDNFWAKYLRHVLQTTRDTGDPVEPSFLLASFNQMETIFSPYIHFCLHQDGCLKYLRDLTDAIVDAKLDKYKDFKEYLAWCETLPQCERFKLRDLMTEPMQRMTRYPLLLKKIRKETEDEKEKKIVTDMIQKSERFISNINRTLRKRFEKEKLETCLQQFEYYTISRAASEEVKWTAIEFLRTDIQCLPTEEQRCFLKKGPMKLIDKRGKGDMDVITLLFTDVIIITKQKRSTNQLQIVRQLFFLDKVTLVKSQSSNGGIVFIYLDEYGLLANTFMLEVSDDERETWIATIERAKVRYENARAGEGSTLDFFQDDYYVPINESSNNDLKDTQAKFRSHAHYESTIDRLEAKQRENPEGKSATFRREANYKDHCRPVSRIHSAPEQSLKNWVLDSRVRRSLPVEDNISDVTSSFRSIKSDSGVDLYKDAIKGFHNHQMLKGVFDTEKSFSNDIANELTERKLFRVSSDVSEISNHFHQDHAAGFQENHSRSYSVIDRGRQSFRKKERHNAPIKDYSDINSIKVKLKNNHVLEPHYEEIHEIVNSTKLHPIITSSLSRDINNNKSMRHVITSKRSSECMHFKSESTQTLNEDYFKNGVLNNQNGASVKNKQSTIATQTDISFSSNVFAMENDSNYLDNT